MAITLNVEERSERGKNVSRRLRRGGRVPGVVYGQGGDSSGGEALSVSVMPEALLDVLRSDSGVNTLIGLVLDGGKADQVLIKDYQIDPISHDLLHVDFYRVAMDKAITVTVPVELTGEPEGVKVQGGVVDFVQRDVAITCLPSEIPERISVEISALMIGDGIRLRELLEGVPWAPVTDQDTLIVHVIAPRLEEEPSVEGEEADTAEADAESEPKIEDGDEKSDS
ncbi:MAG: 50S ribosomal protein L25 [Acidobacteria bacterium]|nr:50S ribosomal protein L25 [Acidobacteriota bacterium]|tara:strand:+ start:1047 stop:1721 length:675 start_codon:yes stop_codon:yes gene_type:complete